MIIATQHHIPINKISKVISKKNFLYNKIINLQDTLKLILILKNLN